MADYTHHQQRLLGTFVSASLESTSLSFLSKIWPKTLTKLAVTHALAP